MSLSIAETLAKTNESKRAAFVAAVWADKPVEELAQIAVNAGLSANDADQLRGRLLNLKSLEPLAATYDERQEAHQRALKTFDAKVGPLRARIDELESQIADLAFAADDAGRALAKAEAAKRDLLVAELNGEKPRGKISEEYQLQQDAEIRKNDLRLKFDRLKNAHVNSLDTAERLEQAYETYRKFGADKYAEFLVGNPAGQVRFAELLPNAKEARENAQRALVGLRACRIECESAGIVLPDPDPAERGTIARVLDDVVSAGKNFLLKKERR